METFEDRGTRRRAARARRKAAVRPKSTRGARALAFVASLGLMSPAPLEAMHSRGTLGIPSIIRVGGSLLYDRAHNTTMTAGTVDDSDPVMTLDALTYTVTITNTGGTGLRGLSVAFTIDANSTYVGASAGGFDSVSQSGGVVTATLASGPVAGGTASFTITVQTPATAMTLTASLSATATNATTQNDSETTDVQLVAKDGTSGIRCPASAAQWTSVRACKGVIGTPFALYLNQESAGSNLADSIGSLTLAYLATSTFQATETGWSRKGIEDADGATGRFYNQSAGVPDCASESMMVLFYMDLLANNPAGGRDFAQFGGDAGTNNITWQQTISSGHIQLKVASNTTAPSPNTDRTGVVRPYSLQWDRTNGKSNGYTDIDKLVIAYTSTDVSHATTRLMMQFGGLNPACRCLFYVAFRGANAEGSTAQVKAMKQALGWTITWT